MDAPKAGVHVEQLQGDEMKRLKRFFDWLFPIHTHCTVCGCELTPPDRLGCCTLCNVGA
jgi:hypothetical protein